MNIKKEDLRYNISQIIREGINKGEEQDLTTGKVVKLVWPIIDYFQTQQQKKVNEPGRKS